MTMEKKLTVQAAPKADAALKESVKPVPVEPVKVEPAKTAAEKKTPKKAEKKPEKKAAAEKKPVKVTLVVEYQGRQITDEQIIAAVKADWKGAAIRSLEVYAKPEDGAAYYVVNGTETGKVYL